MAKKAPHPILLSARLVPPEELDILLATSLVVSFWPR